MEEIRYRVGLIMKQVGILDNSIIELLIVGLCAEILEGLTGHNENKEL